MLTTWNTRINVTSRLFNLQGQHPSIRILLNMEDAMPRMVVMIELRMVQKKQLLGQQQADIPLIIKPPFSILPPLNSEVGFKSSRTPVKFL